MPVIISLFSYASSMDTVYCEIIPIIKQKAWNTNCMSVFSSGACLELVQQKTSVFTHHRCVLSLLHGWNERSSPPRRFLSAALQVKHLGHQEVAGRWGSSSGQSQTPLRSLALHVGQPHALIRTLIRTTYWPISKASAISLRLISNFVTAHKGLYNVPISEQQTGKIEPHKTVISFLFVLRGITFPPVKTKALNYLWWAKRVKISKWLSDEFPITSTAAEFPQRLRVVAHGAAISISSIQDRAPKSMWGKCTARRNYKSQGGRTQALRPLNSSGGPEEISHLYWQPSMR